MEFRTVGEDEHSLVIHHLRNTFFIDEPLNKAVQLCPNGEGHQELEKQCVETMRDGYSIIAIQDDVVFGVALNGVLRPGDTSKALAKMKNHSDKKFSKIFTVLYSLTENLNIFEKYNVDSMLECRIMSVDPRARGKGLANDLMGRSIQMARDNNFKVFKGDATGKFSQNICLKYGMETIEELEYKKHLDPATGLPVFDVPMPHDTLKIMILLL